MRQAAIAKYAGMIGVFTLLSCGVVEEKEDARVKIINNSSVVFSHLCYRYYGAGIWDTATGGPIEIDSSLVINLGNPGIFDLKAISQTGDSALISDRQYVSGTNTPVSFTDDDF